MMGGVYIVGFTVDTNRDSISLTARLSNQWELTNVTPVFTAELEDYEAAKTVVSLMLRKLFDLVDTMNERGIQ